MLVFLIYLSQVVLLVAIPLWLIGSLAAYRSQSWLQLVLRGFVAAAYVAIAYTFGRWDIVGYGLRYLWPALWLMALILSVLRSRHAVLLPRPKLWQLLWISANALILGFFVLLLLQVRGADDPGGKPVVLRFPLEGERWFVVHGGATEMLNAHHGVDAQRYAVDVTRLNRFGLRATGLLPEDPEDYVAFGETVAAPCDGTVLETENAMPDLTPPHMDRSNPAGNYVLMRCGDVVILLAHLRSGTVAVSAGDSVTGGTPLGAVGNSGNSSEPHLHIHAVRGGSPESETVGRQVLVRAEPVPMLFDGRFLMRNDVGGF